MQVGEIYSGKFLRASDLQGREVKLVIATATLEAMPREGSKIALGFTRGDKAMLLNKVNAVTIASGYGPDTDQWVGKAIVVYPDTTFFNGAMVACLRVRIPLPPAASAPTAASAPAPTSPAAVAAAVDKLDDDIPW